MARHQPWQLVFYWNEIRDISWTAALADSVEGVMWIVWSSWLWWLWFLPQYVDGVTDRFCVSPRTIPLRN